MVLMSRPPTSYPRFPGGGEPTHLCWRGLPMVIPTDEPQGPAQATLVVTYGTTPNKHRPLNQPVTVLGRARGCDIGLEAPDVSSVHCVIYRQGGGLRIRDCASRAGTRLNGEAVQEAPLRDGDTLQIGPFSFRVDLPANVRVLAGKVGV